MAATAPPAVRWVHRPRQERSRQTLDRLLDATERLLADAPFDQVSVAQIAAEARSSVGSFYARFPDKEALLHHLQERLYEESRLTARQALAPAAWQGVALPDLVSAVVAFMVHAYRERQGLRRALLVAIAADSRFRDRAADLATETTALLVALLQARRTEVGAVDLHTAVDLCHRILFAVLDQHLLFGDRPPAGHPLTDEQLAAELTRACLAYLEAGRPSANKRPSRRRKK